MGRRLGKVAGLPPAFSSWFTPEPGDYSDHIHGGGIEELLEMRACQSLVPTLTEGKAPGALREATLNPCPQSVLGFEIYRLLPLACGLDGFKVRLRSDGELGWSAFRRGARRTGGTRATGGSVKPDANHRIA